MRRRAWLGLTVALLLACAPPAHAAQGYQVKPGTKTLYVRNKASGYVIGTAFAGQRVDVQLRARRNRWGYGAVYGGLGTWGGAHCGWFQLSGVQQLQPAQAGPDLCPPRPNGIPEAEIFMPGSYFAHVGTGAVHPAIVTACADPSAYGNYDPATGNFASRYGAMPVGRGPHARGFGIRFVTSDGKAAVLKDKTNPAGAPGWFFMRAECVTPLPVYIGAIAAGPGREHLVGDRRVEPTRIEAFEHEFVIHLRWRGWGRPKVAARGPMRASTCDPDCSGGPTITRPGAKVTLHRPVADSCHGQPAMFYTRYDVTYPGGVGVFNRGDTVHLKLAPGCPAHVRHFP